MANPAHQIPTVRCLPGRYLGEVIRDQSIDSGFTEWLQVEQAELVEFSSCVGEAIGDWPRIRVARCLVYGRCRGHKWTDRRCSPEVDRRGRE